MYYWGVYLCHHWALDRYHRMYSYIIIYMSCAAKHLSFIISFLKFWTSFVIKRAVRELFRKKIIGNWIPSWIPKGRIFPKRLTWEIYFPKFSSRLFNFGRRVLSANCISNFYPNLGLKTWEIRFPKARSWLFEFLSIKVLIKLPVNPPRRKLKGATF